MEGRVKQINGVSVNQSYIVVMGYIHNPISPVWLDPGLKDGT